MQFVVAFLKKLPAVPIALFVGGLVLGLVFGWVIWPTEYTNTTPDSLRADLQEDYLRMAIDSYRVNLDPDLAIQRWFNLGIGADQAFKNIQANPGKLDPAVIQAYGETITKIRATGVQPPVNTGGSATLLRSIFLWGGLLVLLGIGGYGGWYMYRLLGKRGSGEVTPTMQAAELNRSAEKTNFEQLGLAPPIAQTMTTYVLGDDLYDESFSIDTQAGEFMGEYGVGVSEAIGVGEPKKVTALEIWLFDKNDIKTATKVLMSQHAFNDPTIRARLEPKGELILVEPQAQVLLETATLQLLATVVDLEYGHGPQPADSYFERITLELAIWPRQG